jgi:hypothetical protein
MAGCCNPLPGEPIIGRVPGQSRGIAIHRQGCPNVERIPGDRLIPVSWNREEERQTPRPHLSGTGRIRGHRSRRRAQRHPQSHLSDLRINVHKAQVKTFPGQIAEIELGLDVRDHAHLEQTFTQVRKMTDDSLGTTITLSTANHPLGVIVGATLGHAICAAIAVMAGKFVAGRLSERLLTALGGGLFILFGLVATWQFSS